MYLPFLLLGLVCYTNAARSCDGICYEQFVHGLSCYCNSACESHNNCCSDFVQLCKGGHAGNHVATHAPVTLGNIVHSSGSIAQQLWDADVNRFGSGDLTVNFQGHTGRGPGSDHATTRLFTYVNEQKLKGPTYRALLSLWDNYITSETSHEDETAHEKMEVDAFLDAVLSTKVMQIAYNYLKTNRVFTGDLSAFKKQLHTLWFDLYSRKSSGPKNSCGFEHIFLGEFKGSSVSGFHNWVRFYELEKSGRIDYKGYINKKEPFLMEFTFTWDGKWKPISSFFIGTSPEFDMALSTICMLSQPNRTCSYTLEGQTFRIQTYDNTHVHGLQVASAYPEM